jgi:hypothetical protein
LALVYKAVPGRTVELEPLTPIATRSDRTSASAES